MNNLKLTARLFFNILMFACFANASGAVFRQHAADIRCADGDRIDPAVVQPAVQGSPLKYPWAGGMNSCQFCSIDLNSDGIMDLLVFDRHGNRKLTFINRGTPNAIDYEFAPAYALKLPGLREWVITEDYNRDGKMDIFTYGNGGVRVFKNMSDTVLRFELVTDLLESFYYTGKVGILVTSVDYPALADIDNDGDMDLLTFFGLGSYVEYHKNLSMEKYGNCDSLDFRLADHCWGRFKESEGGNRITLNAVCPYGDGMQMTNDGLRLTKERHTGSTMLAIDLNGDGLKDLVLGDVDYPNLVALYNGGSADTAFMVEQDTAFPAASAPVRMFSFPAASHVDIDNDGLTDLVVSPFDPALHTSENYNCVRFYRNTGSNVLPVFEWQPDQLFRNEMMDFGSASHPVLYDFDGDGLEDLFVGNWGTWDSSYYHEAVLYSSYTSRIAYFKNTGTASAPVFRFITSDLAGISSLGLQGAYPAIGDLNGDRLADLLVGSRDGTLILYTNAGTTSEVPLFNNPVKNWKGIDVGDYSAPQLFDLDKDLIPDLIIGEQNGNLNYYKNNGTAENPLFSFVTDSLGKVNVTNYNLSYNGFSTPCFARLPGGATFLVTGSDEGRIRFFENIDNNLAGKFTEQAGLYDWLSSTPGDTLFGWQTSPAVGHLTDTEAFDLVIGNFSGGLNYLTKRMQAEIIPGIRGVTPVQPAALHLIPNPAERTVSIRISGSSSIHSPAKIALFNMLGVELLEIPFSGSATLAVSDYPPGIYLVRAGTVTAKLIIRHP